MNKNIILFLARSTGKTIYYNSLLEKIIEPNINHNIKTYEELIKEDY
jgi:hypothetical protein